MSRPAEPPEVTVSGETNLERQQREAIKQLRAKASAARAAAEELPLEADERRSAIAAAQTFEAQADEFAADLGD